MANQEAKEPKKDIEIKETKKAAPEFTIEELAEKHQVPEWVFSGLKAAYGWGSGKQLTEKEFMAKKDAWLKGPMCRK